MENILGNAALTAYIEVYESVFEFKPSAPVWETVKVDLFLISLA